MSVLSGFADADAWTYRADGAIVGRARNSSWAEHVRAGVPIDYFMAIQASADTASATPLPEERVEEGLFEPWPVWPFRPVREINWDDVEDDDPHTMVHHKARRTKGKSKTAKPSKYGPKASKARTIAATVLAEPVAPSGHLTREPHEDYCFVCESPQSTYLMNADTLAKARACDHCSPAFKAELAALAERDRVHTLVAETVAAQRAFALRWLTVGVLYMEWLNDLADFADDAGIEEPTEEDWELERQLQRQRDARYER